MGVVVISNVLTSLQKEYSDSKKPSNAVGYKKALRIWIASYIMFFILLIFGSYFILNSIGSSSDYTEIVYLIVIGMLLIQLIGLATMMKIIIDINQLEAAFFKKNDGLDIVDHFIGEENPHS